MHQNWVIDGLAVTQPEPRIRTEWLNERFGDLASIELWSGCRHRNGELAVFNNAEFHDMPYNPIHVKLKGSIAEGVEVVDGILTINGRTVDRFRIHREIGTVRTEWSSKPHRSIWTDRVR
jgi:hypothetical protein